MTQYELFVIAACVHWMKNESGHCLECICKNSEELFTIITWSVGWTVSIGRFYYTYVGVMTVTSSFLFQTKELEWKLSEIGAVKTDLESDPRKKKERVKDVMTMSVRGQYRDPDDSDDSD